MPSVAGSPRGATSSVGAMHEHPPAPFVCLANQPGHSRVDGSYPPRQLQEGRTAHYHDSYSISPPPPFFPFLTVLYSVLFSFSILSLAPFLCLAQNPLRSCQFLELFGCILCVCLLVPVQSGGGGRRRTPHYIWVNRQSWQDASPRALYAKRPWLLQQNLENEWLVTTLKW